MPRSTRAGHGERLTRAPTVDFTNRGPKLLPMITPPPLASCLASDVGPTRSAFAHLDMLADTRIVVRAAWYADNDEGRLANELLRLRPAGAHGLFAVERIDGAVYSYKGKGGRTYRRNHKPIVETQRVETLLGDWARRRGVTATWIAAQHWRKTLVGDGGASNAQIRIAVGGLFTDRGTGRLELPPMTSAEREHLLDAIGLGYLALVEHLAATGCGAFPVAALRDLRHRLTIPGGILPADVRERVLKQRMEDKADRQAKKLAAELGVTLPRKAPRRPTRAAAAAGKVKAAVTRAKNKLARV